VKLNEVKKVDEVNLSHVVGDYGAAGLKQIGNRLMGNAEGQLSVKDKMAKEKFIADFIGRANTNLNSAIKSGLVDPKMKAGAGTTQSQPAQSQQTQPAQPEQGQQAQPGQTQPVQSTTPNTAPTTATPTTPETPEQKRIRLQKAAQQRADQEAKQNATKAAATPKPETPEQKRIRLQQAAQQRADQEASQFSKLPDNQAQVQASNIRQQKQKVAAQNAQTQMAANPAPTGVRPGVDPEKVNAAQQAAGLPPVYKKTANGGWEETDQYKGTQVKTQQPPAQQTKMTPQQVAALKGKLKAGATATSGQSGFKNYVGGSGQRIQGANPDGSPKVVTVNRESKFYKLNALFESIIEAGEQPAQQTKQTISQYLQNMVTQYMKGRLRDPQSIAQVKAIADEVQNSYPSIKAPLTKLANLVFATSYSQGAGATATAPATQTSPGFMAGLSKGLGATQGAEQSATQGIEQPAQASAVAQQPATTGTSAPTTEPATTKATTTASNAEKQTATTTTGAPAKEPTAYKQALPLISKLDKKGKQRILKYIEKSLGIQSAPAQQEPETKAEPSAFGNMARQLDAMGNKNTSTGGELSSTGRGVKHTSSATNPNKAKDLDDKLNFANKQSTKSTKTRKAKTVGA
jgi:hypothetical protein